VRDNAAPSAAFTYAPATPAVGQRITFTSTSVDPDGKIDKIRWDLDNDGKFDDGTSTTVESSFSTPGPHAVGIRVTDDRGETTASFRTIQVGAPPPPPSPPAPSAPAPAVVSVQPPPPPGAGQLPMLNPFPTVRIRGRILRHGVRIDLLTVRALPGMRVVVRCRGKSCPIRIVRSRGRASRSVRIRSLERWLRAGVAIEVRVTQPNRIGKFTRFRIRGGAAPTRRDLCLRGAAIRPIRCPGL
jgi:PKD domain-containing protein